MIERMTETQVRQATLRNAIGNPHDENSSAGKRLRILGRLLEEKRKKGASPYD